VIENSGDLEALREQVDATWAELIELAGDEPAVDPA